jgi:hypothetical protein
MQSVPITINVLSLHPAHGAVYSIPDYVIKFVSDLQQVSDFSPGRSVLLVEEARVPGENH